MQLQCNLMFTQVKRVQTMKHCVTLDDTGKKKEKKEKKERKKIRKKERKKERK